jgi:hypothetical protein
METVGFPLPTCLRDILPSTTLPLSGLNHTACLLACSSSVLPFLGVHVECAPDRLARRSSGGTCTSGAHPLGHTNQFHEMTLNSQVSGLPWRDHAVVRHLYWPLGRHHSRNAQLVAGLEGESDTAERCYVPVGRTFHERVGRWPSARDQLTQLDLALRRDCRSPKRRTSRNQQHSRWS